MIPNKKNQWLRLLGSSMLLANLAASPVFAQESVESSEPETSETTVETTEETVEESTEESTEETAEESVTNEDSEAEADLKAVGETNPYTEDELIELIKPMMEFDESLYKEPEVLVDQFSSLRNLMEESVTSEKAITPEEVIESFGEPTDVSETGSSQFHRYVGNVDLMLIELEIQYYDEGNGYELANLQMKQTIPGTFEAIEATEEEIVAALSEPEYQALLLDLLGPAYSIESTIFSDRVVDVVTWVDDGHYDRETVDTEFKNVRIEYDNTKDEIEYELQLIDEASSSETESSEDESASSQTDSETEESLEETSEEVSSEESSEE